MKTHPASTAVNAVVESLRAGIRDGRWVPGQRMVEADLIEELEVGRGPVREALRILSGDGLIEIVPHKGARVRRIDGNEAKQIEQVLAALQFLSVELAVVRPLDPADIDGLRSRHRAIEAALERRDKAMVMRAAAAYQSHCNALSGNPYIELAMRRMNVDYLSSALAVALPEEALFSAVRRHGELTEAIITRNADQARAIMRESYRHVMTAFGELGGEQAC